MDIPAAHSTRFSPYLRLHPKTTAIQWLNPPLLTRSLIRGNPRKSVASIFLNCTKNTELTRARFARTVTFAFIKIPVVPAGQNRLATRNQNLSRKLRTQVSATMKSEQWKTYRTRFLVKAKQLGSSLSFVDHLGRQHCGRKGDYLVESSDGVLSIAPRRIFEDIYVPMTLRQEPGNGAPAINEGRTSEPRTDRLRFEPLEIEEVKLPKPPARERVDARRGIAHETADRVRRKLPQSCRIRPSSGMSLM